MAYNYDYSKTASSFEEENFEKALNATHAILDSISRELSLHAEHGEPNGREAASLRVARDHLQKAVGLITKAQKAL